MYLFFMDGVPQSAQGVLGSASYAFWFEGGLSRNDLGSC